MKSLMGLLFVLGQIVRRSLKNIRNSTIVMCEEIDSKYISCPYRLLKVFSRGMKSLIDAGHTRIGYCIGRSNSVNSQRRKKAYEDSLQQSIVTSLETWKFEDVLQWKMDAM